jgi:shikimate kinase
VSSLVERIVLVGLPGAGKTTIGSLLAQELGWQFIDFDTAIAEELGLRVTQIFEQLGENTFRDLESGLTERLASQTHIVLSPGGGWVLRNEMPGALMVWLQVDPQEAIHRMGESVAVRPLLSDNPLPNMQQLYAERVTYYERAAIHIDTNKKTAEDVVDEIAVAVERYGNQEK